MTSAITAPLATGYIAREIFGRGKPERSKLAFNIGAFLVIASGTIGALASYSPVEIIFVAQIANGLLLPIIALFLLKLANNKNLLGEYAIGWKSNVAGVVVLLITGLLGIRLVTRALGYWP